VNTLNTSPIMYKVWENAKKTQTNPLFKKIRSLWVLQGVITYLKEGKIDDNLKNSIQDKLKENHGAGSYAEMFGTENDFIRILRDHVSSMNIKLSSRPKGDQTDYQQIAQIIAGASRKCSGKKVSKQCKKERCPYKKLHSKQIEAWQLVDKQDKVVTLCCRAANGYKCHIKECKGFHHVQLRTKHKIGTICRAFLFGIPCTKNAKMTHEFKKCVTYSHDKKCINWQTCWNLHTNENSKIEEWTPILDFPYTITKVLSVKVDLVQEVVVARNTSCTLKNQIEEEEVEKMFKDSVIRRVKLSDADGATEHTNNRDKRTYSSMDENAEENRKRRRNSQGHPPSPRTIEKSSQVPPPLPTNKVSGLYPPPLPPNKELGRYPSIPTTAENPGQTPPPLPTHLADKKSSMLIVNLDEVKSLIEKAPIVKHIGQIYKGTHTLKLTISKSFEGSYSRGLAYAKPILDNLLEKLGELIDEKEMRELKMTVQVGSDFISGPLHDVSTSKTANADQDQRNRDLKVLIYAAMLDFRHPIYVMKRGIRNQGLLDKSAERIDVQKWKTQVYARGKML
jgi:hypothetical protein